MGVRGRKPVPENIKKLHGRIHAKKKELVVTPLADCVGLSEELATRLPAEVLARARSTLAILMEAGVLGVPDLEAFERYCQHLCFAYEANKALTRDGILSHDEQGILRKHPAMQIHRDNSLAALRYEEQFGLTPSASMRLARTDEQKTEDEYSKFRRGIA